MEGRRGSFSTLTGERSRPVITKKKGYPLAMQRMRLHSTRLLLDSNSAMSDFSPYAGGRGVGVLRPYFPYFSSITVRIARSGFPSACIAITSRVMLRQRSHMPPWLVKVIDPSASRSAT